MSLTRAGVENEIVGALRGSLSNRFFTLSTLVNGSNPDLNGPIRRAIRNLGYDTLDALNVVDADLAPFVGWKVERIIEFAKMETLKHCLGQCSFVDVKTGEDEQMLSQFAAQLRAEIALYEQRNNGASVNATTVMGMTGSSMPNDPFQPCRTRTPYGHWPYP